MRRPAARRIRIAIQKLLGTYSPSKEALKDADKLFEFIFGPEVKR